MNGTVIGTLLGGLLLFISSILVPVITKKLNKRIDDATSAEKFTDIAAKLTSNMDVRLEKAEAKLETTQTRCDECLKELAVAITRADDAEKRADAAERRADAAERRADRNDRTNSALIDAWQEALPLLDADTEATRFLRATIRAARQARYEDQP